MYIIVGMVIIFIHSHPHFFLLQNEELLNIFKPSILVSTFFYAYEISWNTSDSMIDKIFQTI